jgi:hypothetical protein
MNKGNKMGGGGEGKDNVAIENLLVTTWVAIKKLPITTRP